MNYYNEFDHAAAEWLRQLIEDGLIPKGDVDERSIADVRATDLVGYTQCHFFAGISGWLLALQLAGWPEDKPVWTGSCPCQPFSTAGKRKGFSDERDLWPVFFNLIKEGKPEVVFGEQVASSEVVGSVLEADFVNAVRKGDFARANRIAHQLSRSSTLHYYYRWLDRVRADMEAESYAVRGEVLGAHSVGAPHRRYRLYWRGVRVANHNGQRLERQPVSALSGRYDCAEVAGRGSSGDMGNSPRDDQRRDTVPGTYGERSEDRGSGGDGNVEHSVGHGRDARRAESDGRSVAAGCTVGGVVNSIGERQQERRDTITVAAEVVDELRGIQGFPPWSSSRFVYCRDHKIRRVPTESVLLGVADGVPGELDGIRVAGISETGGFPLTTQKEGRAMILKGYGNAINPYCGAEFVAAFMRGME